MNYNPNIVVVATLSAIPYEIKYHPTAGKYIVME